MNCCKNTAKPDELKLLKAQQGIYSLLGFCQRAGRLISGGDAVIKALAAGQVRLLLVADDLSENSQKKLRLAVAQSDKKTLASLKVWRFGTKADLAMAAGKPPRGVWAVCDDNFAAGMAQKLAVVATAGLAVPLDAELKAKK